ncbi:MAG: hypothetical protein KJN62_05495, partial [Deltaproteobacteria bacterium]|nr:hypothetical protein [Deltaproteobacteria bacterium]
MNVAFVTPWPPQPTGIADYAFDLISDLSNHDISVHVFSDCENPVRLNSVEIFNINRHDPKVLRDYDLINYQLGNNIHFNLYMLDLVKRFGGMVHLHDMVLHHTLGWITWAQG